MVVRRSQEGNNVKNRQAPSVGGSLEIRVTQDGSYIHTRVDVYHDGIHRGYSASREKGTLDTNSWAASIATQARQALERVWGQHPLF